MQLVRVPILLTIFVLTTHDSAACARPRTISKVQKGHAVGKNSIDIVPGESIGSLHLGTRIADLPKRATISGPGGELDGVNFFAADGVIEDIWIDDLRKVTAEVRFDGKIVPHDAPLSAVKKTFGPCEEVAGRKGGLFFNCATGVAIGTDFRGAGTFVQIRLKKL